ncbi:hypothetical protein QBC45DRAFT_469452 [Copromyces sp. CBS 386.78]|nr:hypothetical protein QBC45DRAFT_469452 [Copromyces sp. CBS 386.78]
MEFLRLREKERKKEPIEAFPTIIALPSSLVGQTFTELSQTFRDLDFWCWYENPSQIPREDPRFAKTLVQETFDCLIRGCIQNRHKADTAKTVIIAAHTTLTKRWADRFQVIEVPRGQLPSNFDEHIQRMKEYEQERKAMKQRQKRPPHALGLTSAAAQTHQLQREERLERAGWAGIRSFVPIGGSVVLNAKREAQGLSLSPVGQVAKGVLLSPFLIWDPELSTFARHLRTMRRFAPYGIRPGKLPMIRLRALVNVVSLLWAKRRRRQRESSGVPSSLDSSSILPIRQIQIPLG